MHFTGKVVGDDPYPAIHGVRIVEHALHVQLHHVAGLRTGVDRNIQLLRNIGSIVGVIAVSMAEKDGLRGKSNQLLYADGRPAQVRRATRRQQLGAIDVSVEEHDAPPDGHREACIRYPREDDAVGPHLATNRINVFRAEEALARGNGILAHTLPRSRDNR